MDLESVVQKEAVYCTVGRCSKQLKDLIPFEQWLAQLVSTEIRDKNPKCVAYERIIGMADVHYPVVFQSSSVELLGLLVNGYRMKAPHQIIL